MDSFLVAGVVILAIAAVWGAQYHWPRSRTVREHERAIHFKKGRIVSEVGPGRYWLFPRVEDLLVLDTRRRQTVVAGQEVLTSDRVPLKVSLVAQFTVVDVTKAVTVVEDFQAALYAKVQLALREAIAGRDLDAALAERGEIGKAVVASVTEAALEFGVQLGGVQVRDFMLAGGLRSAYADVIQARQQGLAALERARGESAAIRNLANAAQLMEKHPGLMQLRLLQSVESGSGNRIVIALDPERGKSTAVDVTAEGDA